MLTSARLQTLVWTSDTARAGAFYGGVLGLTRTGTSFGALVYEVGDGELRVSPVPSTAPSEHAVLGFAVEDVGAVAEALAAASVALERFPGFDHDPRGVWRAPDGTQVAWVRDPDGNLLSVVQYA
ncbi:VOC family protein [Phenylobacterium sp.]|jgi:catechol 2,3-dioxygenase-like lactoylglutathione lyase family enzyme|uniref:VOC family protein n=1 Tax=Phenylobacterium sp. TaxID=1871053 RepID=UPI001215F8DC|nr:VOC family protein [Phenylobacterium sp.]THD59650.1 MAG: VOC family protein [Phenylobacterium sp.]